MVKTHKTGLLFNLTDQKKIKWVVDDVQTKGGLFQQIIKIQNWLNELGLWCISYQTGLYITTQSVPSLNLHTSLCYIFIQIIWIYRSSRCKWENYGDLKVKEVPPDVAQLVLGYWWCAEARTKNICLQIHISPVQTCSGSLHTWNAIKWSSFLSFSLKKIIKCMPFVWAPETSVLKFKAATSSNCQKYFIWMLLCTSVNTQL